MTARRRRAHRRAGRRPQVTPQAHYTWRYMSLVRTITHWHQANEVLTNAGPDDRVVEIGPGGGHVTWLIQHHGPQVLTVDLDPRIQPDIAASADALPLADNCAHTVLAAEILEHLPFEQAKSAISELARVASNYVVISLPAPFLGLSVLWNLTRCRPRGLAVGLPYRVRHRFQGEHYWELGKWGYSKRRVRAAIRAAGLEIVREFRPFPSLYCYFFVARKRPVGPQVSV